MAVSPVVARTYPHTLPAGTPNSERAVWMALRKLPDTWLIFHHVEWEGERSGRPGDGEADFVLVHPKVGLLVVEVKGGGVSVGGRQWYSFDRNGRRHEIPDPFEQAKTSKYALLNHAKDQIPDLPFLPLGHAVAFPDLPRSERLGLNAPEELMISGNDLADIEGTLHRVTEHWEMDANLASDVVEAIVRLLAPEVEVARTARDDVAAIAARIEFWTNEQLAVLDGLARNDRQLVFGGAGTGKTVLAQEKSRRLAAEGKTVLLTCYNQPLGNVLQSNLSSIPEITVSTFHALCRRLSNQAQTVMRPSAVASKPNASFPNAPTQEFWDREAAELLVEAADYLGFHVDAVVVDEGQDFAPAWWDALELLLEEPETGEFYMFADTHQAIYRSAWRPPFEGASFELLRNCRNTLPIAERVAAVFGDRPLALGTEGVAPEFVAVTSQSSAVKAIRTLVHRLVNEGKLEKSQVAILCQRKSDVEALRALNLAGQIMVGLESWGEGILVETIHRFKGLEADACIVLMFDMDRPWDRALAYIGMSRARAQLYMLASESVRQSLEWGED